MLEVPWDCVGHFLKITSKLLKIFSIIDSHGDIEENICCSQHCVCWWPSNLVLGYLLALSWQSLFHIYAQNWILTLGITLLFKHLSYICIEPVFIPPCFNVEREVYWCPSVRLSVFPSVDRIVSALYLQQYLSDPFHICTSYQTTLEGVSHVKFV